MWLKQRCVLRRTRATPCKFNDARPFHNHCSARELFPPSLPVAKWRYLISSTMKANLIVPFCPRDASDIGNRSLDAFAYQDVAAFAQQPYMAFVQCPILQIYDPDALWPPSQPRRALECGVSRVFALLPREECSPPLTATPALLPPTHAWRNLFTRLCIQPSYSKM